MKKSLVALLFAVASVLPVFAADQGTREIDVKAGLPLYQEIRLDGYGYGCYDYDVSQTFSVGADFFYYIDYSVAIGLGIDHIFNSKIKYGPGEPKDKIGYTNIYFQIKYNFDFDDYGYNNIYPIFQLGYGILNSDWDTSKCPPGASVDTTNGLYWGIGVGTTIARYLILELICSFNYGEAEFINCYPEPDPNFECDIRGTMLKFNVGYKFDF